MKTVSKNVTVYVSDNGQEYNSPTECLNHELHYIQAAHTSKLDYGPVRDFSVLAILISLEPKILDKLEELALLYGMSPRTKKGEQSMSTTSTVIALVLKEETRTITVFTTRDGTEFSDKQSALLHELRDMREKAANLGIDPMNGFCHLAKFITVFPETVPMLNELATTFTD